MICINHSSTNPYFNIASEEYLLKNFTDEVFMLYINEPSVIVGKHQNTLAEVDLPLAMSRGIKIVRRLSGGGSVYHDLGNMNFCFIRNGEEGKLVDFKGFTRPIIGLLSKLGVESKFEGHNSLTINGKKFSGNAEHIYKNRVMHHGTILFSTDLQSLAKILYVNANRYSDKAVKSVRANTTNLCDYLAPSISINDFREFTFNHILKTFKSALHYQFDERNINDIDLLVNTKYSTWEWNFGYSPSYSFNREVKLRDGIEFLQIDVNKGLIIKLNAFGNGLTEIERNQISTALVGCEHNFTKVLELLNRLGLDPQVIRELQSGIF